MSDSGMYSNFKGFCWQDPNIQPYLWGMDALFTFDHTNYVYPLGMIVVAIVCFFLSARTLYLARRPYIGMSLLIAAYCVGTGLFGLARAASDFSRILLLSAASHNAPEWGIIVHLLAAKTEVYKHWKRTQYWMWIVCVFTIYCTDMLASAVFEQSAGIVCDYMLLYLMWERFIQAWRKPTTDPTRAQEMKLWSKGALGSLLHFGQIWSLVFGQGFPVKGGFALLFHVLVALTAIPTFYLYSDFALEFDNASYDFENSPQEETGTDIQTINPQNTAVSDPYLKSTRRTAFWVVLIFISVLLALFTIVGVGQTVGFCGNKHQGQTSTATDIPKLVNYTMIRPKTSDKDAIKSLLEDAILEASKKGAPYNLMENPDHFALLRYESKVQAEEDPVQRAIHSSYFNDIARIAPTAYAPITADPSHDVDLAYKAEISYNVNKLWKVLSNWKDASYLKGCSLDSVTKYSRRCIFSSDSYDNVQRLVSIDKRTKTLTYDIVDGYPTEFFRQIIHLVGTNTTTTVHMKVNYKKRPDTDSNFDATIKSRIEENLTWIQQKFVNKYRVQIDATGKQQPSA